MRWAITRELTGEQDWTLILNKNYDQHLADEYNEKEDVIRLKVKPETLPEVQESLTYIVQPIDDKKGKVSMGWEKVVVSFEVENHILILKLKFKEQLMVLKLLLSK